MNARCRPCIINSFLLYGMQLKLSISIELLLHVWLFSISCSRSLVLLIIKMTWVVFWALLSGARCFVKPSAALFTEIFYAFFFAFSLSNDLSSRTKKTYFWYSLQSRRILERDPWIVFRNDVAPPSWTLILPESWDESKSDMLLFKMAATINVPPSFR